MTIANAVIDSDGFLSEDILSCLHCLYSTVEGTQPLDREFGLSIECVDKPLPIAKNLYALDVVEKTEKYEPRVEVTEVTFEVDGEAILIPHVKVALNEDYEEDEEDEEE